MEWAPGLGVPRAGGDGCRLTVAAAVPGKGAVGSGGAVQAAGTGGGHRQCEGPEAGCVRILSAGAGGSRDTEPPALGGSRGRRALALGSWPEMAGMSKWVQCAVSWPGLGAK